MLVDAHSHFLQDYTPCARLPRTAADLDGVDMGEVLRTMDECGVEVAVTLSQEMTRVRGDWLGSNELAADLQRNYGGRFAGIASFEPLTPDGRFNGERFEEVRAQLRAGDVRGLLITPPYGRFQLNDRRAYPFYQAAAEADAPVYIHLVQPAGEWGEEFNPPDKVEDFPTRLGTLEQVISDFPQLRFNVEHMARPRIDDLLGIMARCPQVWTDVTKLLDDPQLPRYIHTAAEGGFLDRVFWGTDYVGLDAGEWAEWVREGVNFVREGLNRGLSRGGFRQLSASRIDGLLGGNIRRFLGL